MEVFDRKMRGDPKSQNISTKVFSITVS